MLARTATSVPSDDKVQYKVSMKKLLITLLVGLVFLPFMAKSVSAQTADEAIQEFTTALEYNVTTNQPTGQSFVKNSIEFSGGTVIVETLGGDPSIVTDAGGQEKIVYSKGMVGEMTQVMAWMLNSPPATSERAIADMLNSAGFDIVQPVYAQGLGFASLDPILNTWKTFRNMAYLLFVVVFMIIGFLIMMRQKVGGQTVVTAQQAIPHIIIALLLVTFSYAIAGLLIDMMYLVMYLLLALFNKDQESFLNKNFLSLGWVMVSSGTSAAYQAVQEFGESMQSSMGQFGQEALTFLGSLTLAVVVAIAITIKIFELFFELLKTYITIVLTIAFSPIILAMGALPGKDTFKQWVLDLVGNLAAFPTVLLVLIVFDELTGGIGGTPPVIEKGGFQPPYLFGTGAAGVMPFIIGLGMLMIMPEIVKQAKKMMGAKEGVFQTFARDIGNSMKKGMKGGGEIVPGLGFTKVPGAADMAGWGGKKFNQYVARPVGGQIKSRYDSADIRGIWPRKVQQMPAHVDIPEELAKGRKSTQTSLGNVSTTDKGDAPVKDLKSKGTF